MAVTVEIPWEEHQQFESGWWGDCTNTYGEETKQLTYAHRMGLTVVPDHGHWPVYDLGGRSVLDIGGGPVSILLKTINGGRLTVVDPCDYPKWIRDRYALHNVEYIDFAAEEFTPERTYDEVWVYNVLQHVRDPRKVMEMVVGAARKLRIFEWVEMPTSIGHPHTIHIADIDRWIGAHGRGRVAHMNENGCHGFAYFGEFDLR